MTGNEMLAQLGQRMEDTAGVEYTSPIKLEALNNAQLRLTTLLQDLYLTEVEHLESNVAPTAGVLSFSTLETAASNVILNARIQKVKINGGTFCQIIDLSQVPEVSDNVYLTASVAAPYAWVHSESIYVLPATTSAIDVYYLRQPVAIAADAVECELATSLHETILDLAEATLWLTAKQLERSNRAENRAIAYVNALGGE